jgi:ABC-2 type transport system permease protein
VMSVAVLQAIFYLAVGLVFGVRLRSGVFGALALLALASLIALGFAAFGAYAALRTGSTEAVNGLFPVFFVFLIISSMNIPRNLMSVTWFRWCATANPVSYLIEAIRSLVITGWDGRALALGFGTGAAIVVAGFGLSAAALSERMART